MAQEAKKLYYLHNVKHIGKRVTRLKQAIVETIKRASLQAQEVANGLQALRGIAQFFGGTIAAELSNISRG